jgi:hypothetical protein
VSGTVNISRRLFDSEAFKDEPMTEREAWVWLVMEASWKERKKRVGDFIVSLDRAQLAHSTRFMAETWKWTHSKARRFIDRLEKLDMIERKTDTGVSVITICNYEKYQNGKQSTGTGPAQDRHRTGTNEKKDEIPEKKKKEPYGSLSLANDDAAQALAEYNAAAKQAGWPSVQLLTKPRRQAVLARLKECGGLPGWRDALARARASPHCCGQNDRGWTASFDFLTQQSSFAKLMEGNYDAKPRTDRPSPQRRIDPALEQIARLTGLSAAPGDGCH